MKILHLNGGVLHEIPADTLYGADLRGTDLYGADLYGADLRGARVSDDRSLVGPCPLLCIGPIGSRKATLMCWVTDKGLYFTTGCFKGDSYTLADVVGTTHGSGPHAKQYTSAITLAQQHYDLWSKE